MTLTRFKQDLDISGNIILSGDITIGGHTVAGDANTDRLVFNADVDSNVIPDADNTYDLGSATKRWKTAYVNGLTANTRVDVTDVPINMSNVTDAQQTAITAANGDIVYNTTSNDMQFYINGVWRGLGETAVVQTETDPGTFYVPFADAVSGNVTLGADTGITYQPSTNTLTASIFSGIATSAQYADLAENYLADVMYSPGTVLILGGTHEVTVTDMRDDTRVVGVVTTNPAYMMNSHLTGEFVTGVALTGRVPCKVVGKINKGDILTTSAIPGHAEVNNNPKPGTIVGKAIEDKSTEQKGIIEILVGRS
jgi:hypothetical protein